MALTEYRRKRHFDKTAEPRGGRGARSGKAELAFVVQKHAASRLHYDFRLEMGGVLKSWAVPKGPSLDPADKCLAVEVEDHPIEYGGFEGIIPHGQYGGGTVMLWDRGTWAPVGGTDPLDQWKAGKLSFVLHGDKLKGRWLLVRMRPRRPGDKNQWLLRKAEDEFARPHDEYDVRVEQDRSVATRRSMDRIASDADRTWGAAAPAKDHAGNGALATQGKHGGPRPSGAAATRPARRTPPDSSAEMDIASIPGATRVEQLPDVRAELATLVDQAPEGSEWIHEAKFDGYRILAHVDDDGVRLISRNGKDWTKRFAAVAEAVRALEWKRAILDGEIVALDQTGVSNFQSLQGRLKDRGAGLHYYVFDMPCCNGFDLRESSLKDRRATLRGLLDRAGALSSNGGVVRFSESIEGHGRDVFRRACRMAMEGVVSKRLESTYRGERTRDWVKSKCLNRQEFVIGGYTDPQRSREAFGALLLGYYQDKRLIYAGKVGTGFDVATLKGLLARLRPLARPKPAFAQGVPRGEARGAHWVRPQLVAEVEFTQWTREGALRHPSFVGLREDKDAAAVVRERPARATSGSRKRVAAREPEARSNGVHAPARTPPRTIAKSESKALGVALTHPDKVLYPDAGITKRMLAEYYAAVGERMVEYIAGRPLMVVRCPGGQTGMCFHQKNWEGEIPAGAHGVKIKESSTTNRYVVVDRPAGLVWLVQLGALEIHTWGSREDDLERPDRLVFDFDPAPDVPWARVRDGAMRAREMLAELKLESFVNTTGGKGVHVVAPLRPKAGWDDAKQFARNLAMEFVRRSPHGFIATMSKAKRTGKIFVDYLRNGRGATCIAPYSTRARPGAPVATPITWEELAAMNAAPAFDMSAAADRVRESQDPWLGMAQIRQSIRGSPSVQ